MLQHISDAVAASGIPFLDLAANQVEFAQALHDELAPAFAKLGLKLEMRDDAERLAARGAAEDPRPADRHGHGRHDMGKFMQYQTAQAIPTFAAGAGGRRRRHRRRRDGPRRRRRARPGDGATSSARALQRRRRAAQRPPPPAAAAVKPEDVMATLEKLGEMKAKGILTQEEFDAKKAELLKKLA